MQLIYSVTAGVVTMRRNRILVAAAAISLMLFAKVARADAPYSDTRFNFQSGQNYRSNVHVQVSVQQGGTVYTYWSAVGQYNWTETGQVPGSNPPYYQYDLTTPTLPTGYYWIQTQLETAPGSGIWQVVENDYTSIP